LYQKPLLRRDRLTRRPGGFRRAFRNGVDNKGRNLVAVLVVTDDDPRQGQVKDAF